MDKSANSERTEPGGSSPHPGENPATAFVSILIAPLVGIPLLPAWPFPQPPLGRGSNGPCSSSILNAAQMRNRYHQK